jgi:hypothetical protein
MEKKLIFSDFGCEIHESDGRFFISYESGESAGSKLIEQEITVVEVRRAIVSEKAAYEVILEAEKRRL